jgi:hypothetical protein
MSALEFRACTGLGEGEKVSCSAYSGMSRSSESNEELEKPAITIGLGAFFAVSK